MFNTFFEKLLFGSFFTCVKKVFESGCRRVSVVDRVLQKYGVLRYVTSQYQSMQELFLREMLHDVNDEHIFWVRFRVYRRHLKGRERLGRDPVTPFRRA